MDLERLTVYFKSTCKTCQKIIAHHDAKNIGYQKIDYFRRPFTLSELEKIFAESETRVSDALRKNDEMYKELKLGGKKLLDNEILG